MSSLIGTLVDVSGSMRENATGDIKNEKGEWARSVFSVIDNLIKHDVSEGNFVFAVGVGAYCGSGTFDLLGTIKKFQTDAKINEGKFSYGQIIERIFMILESNGAPSIRKWAQQNIIKETVSYDMACVILTQLELDAEFRTKFINNCLPRICRDVETPSSLPFAGLYKPFTDTVLHYTKKGFDYCATSTGNVAKEEDIIEVVDKAKSYLLKNVLPSSIMDVHKASEIVHGCIDDQELSNERVNELMKTVEPFIYGRTPLFKALSESKDLFLEDGFSQHKKLLFVLSDGEPTDDGNLEQLVSKLSTAGVTVVSCYITKTRQVEPMRLYSSSESAWDEHANFLFKLSSKISTQLLPRTIFIKRGWKIDIDNNETRLFLHVNHPDILKDACDLARNVVCSQDALSDLLVSLSLDMYINQSTAGFKAQKQKGGTCYANASAAVLHLAMKRILGREGGYPDFTALRQEMITLHGDKGAVTLNVLEDICPKYRLHCQEVGVVGAMHAITAKRPVVAIFGLTDSEWDKFSKFFTENPTGILTKKELEIKRPTSLKISGHAVVLTSFNSECLRLMNSWGHTWGDMGFFRVGDASVLDLEFIDVYWTLNDLTEKEQNYHAAHGKEVAATLVRNLKALQIAKYECPLCSDESFVTDFTGSLLQAQCPKCNGIFKCDETGNILALNMYLLSLSR